MTFRPTPGAPAAALLVVALTALPSQADFDDAVAAYKKGDYAAAAEELGPLADRGNAEAQFYMAYMYEAGRGVERDEVRATEYYALAAEQGHDRAQFNLGLAYELGRGVTVDVEEALRWYLESANQDFARAQYKAAEMFLEGHGTRRDPMRAYQWFKLAGSQRFEDAKRRRKQVAKQMTPYQIAEADMLVRQWRAARAD